LNNNQNLALENNQNLALENNPPSSLMWAPTCASNFNYAEASAALLAALKIGGLEDISLHFWHSL
jgi:hypothetical protein